jgi:hypothetical protein
MFLPIFSVVAFTGPTTTSTSYTYYIDPYHGDNSNSGNAYNNAWKSPVADTVTLTGSQSIGYFYNGTWYLYRSLNMTADQAQLAANLVTATANQF